MVNQFDQSPAASLCNLMSAKLRNDPEDEKKMFLDLCRKGEIQKVPDVMPEEPKWTCKSCQSRMEMDLFECRVCVLSNVINVMIAMTMLLCLVPVRLHAHPRE